LTILQCEPREAVSYQRSAVSRAQQRLYFWPEPQGHWAFLAGCGGALTVLQCEPGEVYSSAKASDSRLCCRLSLMSEVSSTAFRTGPPPGAPNSQPAPLMDMGFAVIGPLARCRMPAIGFLFIGSYVCSTLLSDLASRQRPCASLSLHLHQVVKRTFTFKLSNIPAHQKEAGVMLQHDACSHRFELKPLTAKGPKEGFLRSRCEPPTVCCGFPGLRLRRRSPRSVAATCPRVCCRWRRTRGSPGSCSSGC